MFEEEGRSQLEIDVDGKSFKRRFSHGVSVREPFGVTKEKVLRDGRTYYQINVETFSQFVDPQNLQVVARVKDPRGRSSIKPFSLDASDIWRLELAPEFEGVYDVRLRISGEDNSGSSFDVDPEPITITYPDEDNPFATEQEPEPAPVVEPEPKPEPKPEPEPEPAPVVEEPAPVEEESSSWPLYVGLAVGNLLILVLAFFAYRMIMGSGDGDSLKDLEEAVEASEQADTEPEAPPAEEVAEVEDESTADEPAMEEVSAAEPEPAVDAIEVDEPPQADETAPADEDLADNLMNEDLDLSSDASAEADLMPADEGVAAEAEDLLAELGMGDDDFGDDAGDDSADDSFSLDDFAPDNMDDADDEENKS
jgi:outer membrane biosynthesis protein TonB